jgi:hypothetical protein
MKRLTWISTATLVVLASAIAAPASKAGVDVSFGVNAPVGNDGNLFFSISSRYFDRQPQVVEDWGRRFQNPDDLAVFMQICSQSRQAPEVVFNYRRQGMSWYDVGVRVGVPVDFWYVPVVVDPGPPYAKPYKRYHKHQHDPQYVVRLSDRELRDLVAVRMAHEYYGVTPEVAMNWRRDGSNVQAIMTREYRQRHRDDHGYHDHDSDHDSRHNKHHDSNGHRHDRH